MVDRDDLTEHVEKQIETAIAEADLILFVVDIRDELMPLDEEVAPAAPLRPHAGHPGDEQGRHPRVRRPRRRVLQARPRQADRRLDPPEPQQEAALEADRRDAPRRATTCKPADAVMKIAVVGRPNTGKSTFINTLARAERMIVSERPGTTRDSVDVRFELDGLPFLAIDTAGRPAQGQDPRQPRLLLDPPRRAVDPPRRRRPALPRPDPGDLPARQAAGRLHRQAVQAVHLRGQQVGPDGRATPARTRRRRWRKYAHRGPARLPRR